MSQGTVTRGDSVCVNTFWSADSNIAFEFGSFYHRYIVFAHIVRGKDVGLKRSIVNLEVACSNQTEESELSLLDGTMMHVTRKAIPYSGSRLGDAISIALSCIRKGTKRPVYLSYISYGDACIFKSQMIGLNSNSQPELWGWEAADVFFSQPWKFKHLVNQYRINDDIGVESSDGEATITEEVCWDLIPMDFQARSENAKQNEE